MVVFSIVNKSEKRNLRLKINLSFERDIATTIAIAIVRRAIAFRESIQKRGHEPMYKSIQNIQGKSDNFWYGEFGKAINTWVAIEKYPISKYW